MEKYAIISDVHGNYPALEAVLSDAKEQGATQYLLLGDYTNGSVFGNEVVEAIRRLENATVICGNHEGFLRMIQANPDGFADHSGLIKWCFHNLKPENLRFLLDLSNKAVVADARRNIYLSHDQNQIIDVFFTNANFIKHFHSVHYRAMFEDAPIPYDIYLQRAKEEILSDPKRAEKLKALPIGVYLFGHNHIQFYMEYEGKMFINPGSCGEPLDGTPSAAYTLLQGKTITERRVAYDVDACAQALRKSSYYNVGKFNAFWVDMINKNLLSGFDYFRSFYALVNETTRKRGERGVANEACMREAINRWENN